MCIGTMKRMVIGMVEGGAGTGEGEREEMKRKGLGGGMVNVIVCSMVGRCSNWIFRYTWRL
jgi:hypothetical protein